MGEMIVVPGIGSKTTQHTLSLLHASALSCSFSMLLGFGEAGARARTVSQENLLLHIFFHFKMEQKQNLSKQVAEQSTWKSFTFRRVEMLCFDKHQPAFDLGYFACISVQTHKQKILFWGCDLERKNQNVMFQNINTSTSLRHLISELFFFFFLQISKCLDFMENSLFHWQNTRTLLFNKVYLWCLVIVLLQMLMLLCFAWIWTLF